MRLSSCGLSRLNEILASGNSMNCSLAPDTEVLDKWKDYRTVRVGFQSLSGGKLVG